MNLFFTVVFPSLLPFFILSEMMLGLGVVHFIGVLFTPLMRPCSTCRARGRSCSPWAWRPATPWTP